MLVRVYSDSDYMALNTDRINSIVVNYDLVKETRYLCSVTVIFDVSKRIDNTVLFTIDFDSEAFKIKSCEDIGRLKTIIIDKLVDSFHKNRTYIDVEDIVANALHEILCERELDK